MTNTTTSSRPLQGGPDLALLAAISTGLLLAGLVASAALGGALPSPSEAAAPVREYFLTQPSAVLARGALAFGSAVPLTIYAATASARLRQLGVTAPGATIGLAGGILAGGMLALSGLLLCTLARPAVRGAEPVVPALHDLAFLTGGPAHIVFLGLLVAGIAVPGLLLRLLSRPVAIAGLAIAALAELTALAVVWPALSPLLPVARFPALLWLVAAGLLLPQRRPRREPTPTQPIEADRLR